MSYDITLKDPVTHEIIEFDEPHQMKPKNLGIRGIYGKTGAEWVLFREFQICSCL